MTAHKSAILDHLGRPFSVQNSLENPALSLDDPATWEGVMSGITTTSGVRLTARTALGQPAIWRAISLITGDVARLPLTLYERNANNGKEPAKSHPAYRLMRRKVNTYMTASSFKRVITYHALMHGNGCALKVGTGRDTELLLLNPEETCLLIVDEGVFYRTEIHGEERLFDAADIYHVKGLSHDGLWGHNVIEVMAEAFGLSAAAREFGSRFFGEGTNASGLLMVPGHFDETKAKNTLAAWREMQTSLKNSHKVALLQDGVKWQQLTIPPETAQFLETRQFEIREIANVFGCPPHKLGDDTRTSHNSLEQENADYIDSCLDPWLVEHEEQANLKLLSEQEQDADSHFFEFNRNARLRTDAKTRAEVYQILFGTGSLSPNDILARENMPTIGEIGDLRFRPANFVPLDAPAPTEGSTQKAEGSGENPEARAKLLDCLIDRLDRLQRIEAKRVEGRESSVESQKDWYSKFAPQIEEAVTPVVAAAWCVLAPAHDPKTAIDCIHTFVWGYIGQRTRQLESEGGWKPLDLAPLAESLLPS